MKKVQTITETQFRTEITRNDLPMLIEFSADWCAPCRELESILDDFLNLYHNHMKIFRIDVEDNPILVTSFNIRSIPTLLFFDKQGVLIEQVLGLLPKHNLDLRIKIFLNKEVTNELDSTAN